MLLPGWTRRVVEDNIYYEDIGSFQLVDGVPTPMRSVRVRATGITLHCDPLRLSSAFEVEAFCRMLVTTWLDVFDLRGRTARALDVDGLQQQYADGFTDALQFCLAHARRSADEARLAGLLHEAASFQRLAEGIEREATQTSNERYR